MRPRYHLLSRLAKAAKCAGMLSDLCATRGDKRARCAQGQPALPHQPFASVPAGWGGHSLATWLLLCPVSCVLSTEGGGWRVG